MDCGIKNRGKGQGARGEYAECAHVSRHRGFSFIEVLFAVMILGVGFIMIAAIFPVAIQQTQLTADETSSQRVFQNGKNVISAIPTTAWPAGSTTATSASVGIPLQTGKVISFREKGPFSAGILDLSTIYLNSIRGNQINAADARYAWVPLYQRNSVWDTTSSTAIDSKQLKFYFFVAAVRNRSLYKSPDDIVRYTAGTPTDLTTDPQAVLEPIPVTVTFSSTNVVTFPAAAQPLIAEGAFLIVSDDPVNAAANGGIFRVGAAGGVAGDWQLAPGYDLSSVSIPPTPGNPNVRVFVVGKGLADPKNPATSSYEGAIQDISVFSSTITLP